MKFSEQWLRVWTDPAIDTRQLAEQLTMAGLEVEGVEPVAGEFRGVVVAQVADVAPHPDAESLWICQVDDGSGELLQIVCGAANVRAGMKVPLARIGATLPDGSPIKRARLRGVESQGMLCAAAELALGEDDDGLLELAADAPVGSDLRDWLQLDDVSIELDLTPNRADCLSIAGIAREVAVLNQQAVQSPVIESIPARIDDRLPVSLEAPDACPRYVGRIIRNVDVSQPSPTWLTERLRRSGIRSIDPVVDVTNYVLLELGQPMHAFDLAKLQGGIRVRAATAGEKLTLLDDQVLELEAGELVIADQHRAVALAGIMGGAATAVSAETRHLFLEAAFFSPRQLAGRARHYGLHTDSSHRFERGVDPARQAEAMERATELITAIVGGEPGPLVDVTESEHLPRQPAITLRRARIARVLGMTMEDREVERILQDLGMTTTMTEVGWLAMPPTWRFDLAIEADLLEELARVHGYHRLPVRDLDTTVVLAGAREADTSTSALSRQLMARGYREAITYSFVDPGLQRLLDPECVPVAVTNPISSDMSVMRTTLWAGLLGAARYNSKRQQQRLRLFESGLRFIPTAEGLQQEPSLALLLSGRREPESWASGQEAVDFHDLKGDVEALLQFAGIADECHFIPAAHAALHPGQCAAIYRGDRCTGYLGQLHPRLQRQLELPQPVFLAEMTLDSFCNAVVPTFQELSRFPEVRRDLALLVPRELLAQTVLDAVRKAAGETLQDLRLFDIYEGKGIDPQRKSIALGLTFRHSSRTLKDGEVNAAMEAVIGHLASEYGATLRN